MPAPEVKGKLNITVFTREMCKVFIREIVNLKRAKVIKVPNQDKSFKLAKEWAKEFYDLTDGVLPDEKEIMKFAIAKLIDEYGI